MYDLFSQIAEATNPATTAAAIIGTPTQPEEIKSQPRAQEQPKRRIFTNVADIFTELRKIGHAELMNWEQFTQLYKDITDQRAAIMVMINKMTMAEIDKYIYKLRSDVTKKERVEDMWESIIGSFNLGGLISYSISYFGGTKDPGAPSSYEEALTVALSKQTPETLALYQESKAADRAKRKKALENPETLEEFRTFLTYRPAEAMTAAQCILYDQLITEGRQQRRQVEQERKAEVTAVKVEGLEMEIKTSHHAKKNIPLWVVTLSDRVEAATFTELKAKAHKFDGYYSSYRGQGAIPGFTFEAEENAKLFAGLTEGNQSAHEIQQAQAAETRQDRAETLEEKAARIKAEAEEVLNRDRKTNTHKRAREAASAANAALYKIEFAETMAKIAQGQQDGTVKFLTLLSTMTELDTLNSILGRAKEDYIKAKGIKREEYELCPEVVNYVKFPYPNMWISNVMPVIGQLANVPGCKMAAARMLKIMKATKADFVTVSRRQELEDFETLLCTPHKGVSTYSEYHKADLLKYKRVMRLQLESLPELRTALRELVNIKLGAKISPEMKKAQEIRELERKFIGSNIDGFFPTPAALVNRMIDQADIQEGHTILEPSAGLGHIADVISERHPDNPLTVCEISYSLCEALKLKGYEIDIREDFLKHTNTYDRIIMNPPFENGQDITHVLHAFSLLNPGGRLVAIMAGNKGKSDKKTTEFVEFVQNQGGSIEENPAGSFLSSFRPTGVNTITVILDK